MLHEDRVVAAPTHVPARATALGETRAVGRIFRPTHPCVTLAGRLGALAFVVLTGCTTTRVVSPEQAVNLRGNRTVVASDGRQFATPRRFRATLMLDEGDDDRAAVPPREMGERCADVELVPKRDIDRAKMRGWSFERIRFTQSGEMSSAPPWFVVKDDSCVRVPMSLIREVRVDDADAETASRNRKVMIVGGALFGGLHLVSLGIGINAIESHGGKLEGTGYLVIPVGGSLVPLADLFDCRGDLCGLGAMVALPLIVNALGQAGGLITLLAGAGMDGGRYSAWIPQVDLGPGHSRLLWRF